MRRGEAVTDTMHAEKTLTLSDFDFEFPEELVAQSPVGERDSSRLLLRTAAGTVAHHRFSQLPELLPERSLIIVNDTSVLQSRLHGFLKTGARVEIFLLEALPDNRPDHAEVTWRALAKPLKKLRQGAEILFPPLQAGGNNARPVTGRIIAIEPPAADGEVPAVRISFSPPAGHGPFNFMAWLDHAGETPLPPYIHREQGDDARKPGDRQRYETVYANMRGSVAAPTAGLHFTPGLLQRLQDAGHEIAKVTLHVGGGTFLPVRQEEVSRHVMHTERFLVPAKTLQMIDAARTDKRAVICTGTTSFRSVESLFRLSAEKNSSPESLADVWHPTQLYVYPRFRGDRYQSLATDGLITNFHQPKSTLFMLVSALIGLDEAQAMYREAIAKAYRLFSYGDASLLLLRDPARS